MPNESFYVQNSSMAGWKLQLPDWWTQKRVNDGSCKKKGRMTQKIIREAERNPFLGLGPKLWGTENGILGA